LIKIHVPARQTLDQPTRLTLSHATDRPRWRCTQCFRYWFDAPRRGGSRLGIRCRRPRSETKSVSPPSSSDQRRAIRYWLRRSASRRHAPSSAC